MGVIRFGARLQRRGPAAAVVPGEAQVAGSGKRQTVPGGRGRRRLHLADQRGPVGGEFLAGLNREVRDGAGVQVGGDAELAIELGWAPREAQVPGALATAVALPPGGCLLRADGRSPTVRTMLAGSRTAAVS